MPRVLVQTSLRGCSLHRAGSMCICVRKGTSPQRQREYLAGFQGKTSSRSQRFADRKQTCPPALCRCTGVDKPQHPRARAGSSCALPARAAPALSSSRGSPARAAFHPRTGSSSITPASAPSAVPSHPASRAAGSPSAPWGKAGGVTIASKREGQRREGRRKPITGTASKVAEGAGPGRSPTGRTADYFAWVVEEKRRL